MVGNSLRSDVVPALAAGAGASMCPHDLTWNYERDVVPESHDRFRQIADLGELAGAAGTLLSAFILRLKSVPPRDLRSRLRRRRQALDVYRFCLSHLRASVTVEGPGARLGHREAVQGETT